MRAERRGFVLVVALLAIVCLSAMLTALAFISREDHMLSAAGRDAQLAFVAAEGALWSAATALDTTHLALPLGGESRVAVAGSTVDTVRALVRRLGPGTFLVLGEAAVRGHGGLVWRRVGLLTHAARDSSGTLAVVPLPGRSWMELP